MRLAVVVEYDGSFFHGWQAQPSLRTVQQVLEDAISKVAAEQITITCAGRTDTGVHATMQVVHFDAEHERQMRSWLYGINANLPKDLCVKFVKEVSGDFNARYSALSRRYQYVIYNNPVRPALQRSNVTWQYRQLDQRLMHEAAQILIGEHDFTSFRSVECQSHTAMRNVMALHVTRKEDLVVIDITANAFLHHMVRNIAGVLMMVGAVRKPVEWVAEVLDAKDRRLGAETAPPYGLYLVDVAYPHEFNLNNKFPGPLFL